jgi:beta-glucosidase
MNTARLVFPAIRWGDRSPDHVWPEVRQAIELGVGGFVVFGGSVSRMRELVKRAQDHAGWPLLFASDLERGAGHQLGEATPLPPAAALAGLADRELLEAARITAQEAASAGIGWVLAPVADLDIEPANPIVGTRSFGAGSAAVSDLVRSWVLSAQAEGVNACAKHFPGHGRTTTDSHAGLPVVPASREVLQEDITPFRLAIDAGVRSIMMAHVSYPALDPTGTPASLSPAIVRFLREELKFDGLVATDALIMEAVSASGRSEVNAAVDAIRAGCDVVLYPSDPALTVAALDRALQEGRLEAQRVAAATYRIVAAAARAEILADEVAPTASYDRALELATASVRLVRGSLPATRRGQRFRVHVLDDDIVALPEVVAAPGMMPTDQQQLTHALRSRSGHVGDLLSGEAAIDLVAVFCGVKAWKKRSGMAPETVRQVEAIVDRAPGAVVILFGHPRLAEQISAVDNVLCAWCGDTLMQDAVAERLMMNATR